MDVGVDVDVDVDVRAYATRALQRGASTPTGYIQSSGSGSSSISGQ